MQSDDFDDLPPRLTLKQFFAQVGPRTGPLPAYLRKPEPPAAPEFEQPPAEKFPGPLFEGEPFE